MAKYRRGHAEVGDLMERMSAASAASATSSQVASKAQPATVETESDSDLEDDNPPPAPRVYTAEDKIHSAVRLSLVNSWQRKLDELLKKRKERLGEEPWDTPTDLDTQIAGKLSALINLTGKMPVSFESWTNKWHLRPEQWGDTSAETFRVRSAPQQEPSTAGPISTRDDPGASNSKRHRVKPRKEREDTSSQDNSQRRSPGAHAPPLPTQDHGLHTSPRLTRSLEYRAKTRPPQLLTQTTLPDKDTQSDSQPTFSRPLRPGAGTRAGTREPDVDTAAPASFPERSSESQQASTSGRLGRSDNQHLRSRFGRF